VGGPAEASDGQRGGSSSHREMSRIWRVASAHNLFGNDHLLPPAPAYPDPLLHLTERASAWPDLTPTRVRSNIRKADLANILTYHCHRENLPIEGRGTRERRRPRCPQEFRPTSQRCASRTAYASHRFVACCVPGAPPHEFSLHWALCWNQA